VAAPSVPGADLIPPSAWNDVPSDERVCGA